MKKESLHKVGQSKQQKKRVNATLNFSSFLDCYLRPHVSKKSQIGSSGGTSLNRAKKCIFYFMLGELLLRPRN